SLRNTERTHRNHRQAHALAYQLSTGRRRRQTTHQEPTREPAVGPSSYFDDSRRVHMEWVGALSGRLLTAGVPFLFFWTLVGQYAYREAKAEDRSLPKRRGLCWGVLGIVGVIDYLRDIENRTRAAWA